MANNERDQNESKTDIHFEKIDQKKGKYSLPETLESLKRNANLDAFLAYARNNIQETVAYALLILGVILSMFQGFIGDLLVGCVTGFYFSKKLFSFVKSYEQFFGEYGLVRCVVCLALLFVLFISAPGVFIGAVAMTAGKVLLRIEH